MRQPGLGKLEWLDEDQKKKLGLVEEPKKAAEGKKKAAGKKGEAK